MALHRVAPSEGDTYTVTSEVVHATADELAKVKIPTSELYDHVHAPLAAAVARRRAPGHPPRRPPQRLAAAAARGATRSCSPAGSRRAPTSELEVVRRVEDYLTSGRFRYTTDVEEPGADPLLDFLFKTRAGYCQHFAGAAALLLRLAGVPTRVVSGFATGKRTGENTYDVRDEDAHAWIEVYFPGYGWVPFNPTPASAEADVAPETDVLAARSAGGGIGLRDAHGGPDRSRAARAGRHPLARPPAAAAGRARRAARRASRPSPSARRPR